jgi:8-oxo-dGTP diphosphatase
VILLRHASAGDRERWQGDDRERPLDERGRKQSEAIVARLAGYPVERILTSPALRCIETVEPLAAARALTPELRDELAEELQETEGWALVRSLAREDVVVCGHGGLEHALPDPPKWRKGAALVVDETLAVVETI